MSISNRLVKQDGIFEVKSVFKVEDKEGGNVREVLELSFPLSIQPYFLVSCLAAWLCMALIHV